MLILGAGTADVTSRRSDYSPGREQMSHSDQPTPETDRRKHGRAGIQLEAVLRGPTPAEDLTIEMINFSVGGFYCKVSRPLELMTKLGIDFQFPAYGDVAARSIEAVAVVVRAEPRHEADGLFRIAACFIDMDRVGRDHVDDYVEWYHEQHSEGGRQSA